MRACENLSIQQVKVLYVDFPLVTVATAVTRSVGVWLMWAFSIIVWKQMNKSETENSGWVDVESMVGLSLLKLLCETGPCHNIT